MQSESRPQSVASSIDGSRGWRRRSPKKRLIAGGLAASVAAAGIAVVSLNTAPQVSGAVTPTCSYANPPMLILKPYTSTTTVTGSSTVTDFVGAIPVQNVNFGSSQTLNIGGSGAGAGKITFGPLTFTKPIEATSPQIFSNEATGTPYQYATIYSGLCINAIGESQANPLALTTIKLGLVAVKSISTTLDPATESIAVQYGAYQLTTLAQNPDGSFKPPVTKAWDAVKNIAWDGTSAP